MDEIERFTDPTEWYGLRSWRFPEKSRLLRRLAKIRPLDTIAPRRGYYILRAFLGEGIDSLEGLALEYAYQRLLVLDWATRFKTLGFFTESEVRDHARLYGPPCESVLGHFWYGLLGGEDLAQIERTLLRRPYLIHAYLKAYRTPRSSIGCKL